MYIFSTVILHKQERVVSIIVILDS